jgi:hypothetical protein
MSEPIPMQQNATGRSYLSPRQIMVSRIVFVVNTLALVLMRPALFVSELLLVVEVLAVLAYGLWWLWRLHPAWARILPALNATAIALGWSYMIIGPDSLFGVSNFDVTGKLQTAGFLLMPFTLLSLMTAFALQPAPEYRPRHRVNARATTDDHSVP